MMVRFRPLAVLAVVALSVFGACGDDDDQDTGAEPAETTTTTTAAEPEASVRFAEPVDGATVTSPVKVHMEATNFSIEPAGDGTVKEGSGHFHIVIDAECVTPGQVIVSDATHQHYGKAQTEAELTLAAGSHTLCLQVGDAAHTALDLTDQVTVQVTG